MGYYTRYELQASPWPDELSDAINTDVYYGIDKYGESAGKCKWYDHENDMRKLSLQFPAVRFTLHGEGEEPQDLWQKHFVNGKMQRCSAIIEFPPFDESKLE